MTISNGLAFEATMMHGCRTVPVDMAMQGVASYQDMPVPVPDISEAEKFGWLQSGKGYDFMGAFGIPFLKSDDWSDWSKWWCSELCFMQLGMGGLWLLDKDVEHRVTPQDLYDCNYPKSPRVILK